MTLQQTETSTDDLTTPATSSTADTPADKAAQRRQAFLSCERTLSGHPRRSLRAELQALADGAADDDLPDIYGEGALIEGFEREIATLLGKEAAVFMPSGTMAQQIALRIWSERTGRRTVAFHPTCHLEIHERKGYERLHGLNATLVGDANRLITMDDLRATPEPLAALLLELPQREIGGQLPEWEALEEQTAWARARGAAAHMDGARLWEAAPYYGREYAEVAGLFDSVYVSFYKGIGAIAGAALAGPADFIAEAKIWQRRHGGNLIHLYPYVLAARSGLRQRLPRFAHYHERAVEIAAALSTVDGVALKPNPPQSHMAHVYLRGDPDALLDASAELARERSVALFSWLRPTPVPGYAMFEMSIGDGADAFTPDEVAEYMTRVIERAAQTR
ncbi:MAG TPA: beta-eliminating lyase-related protein [Ktedonobacterales bacterium]|nr:beta-eliminating lyase-related protein [Ktedonobacterales bacterium]